MDFEGLFPLRFWINLGSREDRRIHLEAQLEEVGLSAERFAAVRARSAKKKPAELRDKEDRSDKGPKFLRIQIGDSSRVVAVDDLGGSIRGYESPGRYALGLTQRLAVREARRRKSPSVLLIEDDAVFHPNFRALISAVELPDDWEIFYLGCTHTDRPEWSGSRVVRCRYALDTHAIGIRATCYDRVLEILDRHRKPDLGIPKASDQFLALLHRELPAYSCYPNLVWQGVSLSNLTNQKYSNYRSDGRQKNFPEAVHGILEEYVCQGIQTGREGKGAASSPTDIVRAEVKDDDDALPKSIQSVRLGLLLLTRGDVNHPEIWGEFVDGSRGRVRVLSHSVFGNKLVGGFLDGSSIGRKLETKWGDISLVRASRALVLEALEDESLTHFVLLSEACVPIRPLSEILGRIELDPRPQFGFRSIERAISNQAARIRAVPEIPSGCWRFTSQWWLMDRTAAVMAVGQDFTSLFERMFAPDESYFATVLAMQGYPLEGQVINQDVTWTSWENKSGNPVSWMSLPRERLIEMIHSNALFARKFPVESDIGIHRLHCL